MSTIGPLWSARIPSRPEGIQLTSMRLFLQRRMRSLTRQKLFKRKRMDQKEKQTSRTGKQHHQNERLISMEQLDQVKKMERKRDTGGK